MRNNLVIFVFVFLPYHSFAQEGNKRPAIIPRPSQLTVQLGRYVIPSVLTVRAAQGKEMASVLACLENRLATPTGKKIVLLLKPGIHSVIRLTLNDAVDTALASEGYRLKVDKNGITIRANAAAGLYYGIQTLVQLFPPEIEQAGIRHDQKWSIPRVDIVDKPRFEWRGLMFDVSRHFFTKAEVEQYIDQMARYKFNVLHLHLADDEGWRLEIKAYPKLTTIGAFSVKKLGYFGTFPPPLPTEARTYGGYYTHEDIRELVLHAKAHFINILPEIDVPGHSLAAIAAYPELSCTPAADTYHVRSGEQIMKFDSSGLTALVDNTLCPANEKVYTFLDAVLTEVAALFPFGYIHMGGDECAKNFWEKSEAIKRLMSREKLKDPMEVQSYFEKRLEKIVESKGKKFMGWDEILEGGLAPDAVVMSWRGMKGGITAAKMKHDVVMSPTNFVYLDYMQGDRAIEPHVYSTLRLNKTYEFEPLPDSVDAKYILGGQANLWTEQVYTLRHAEYMTWPRAFAVSESLWSPKKGKNWLDFSARVEVHFSRLDFAQINYAPSVYDPIFSAKTGADSVTTLSMTTEIPGLVIHYSFDNSFPDQFYPSYSDPLAIPKEAVMMRAITYRGGKRIGRMISLPLDELRKRKSQ